MGQLMEISQIIFELDRFIQAQDKDNTYATALREIREGEKRSHWIWFVFPQVKGLGHSWMSNMYGISSLLEAKAYLEDGVLNDRLKEITTALISHKGTPAEDIFGILDAMKVRSCMTLFDIVQPNDIWNRVLEFFFHGKRCTQTLELIDKEYAIYSGSVCMKHGIPFPDDVFFNTEPNYSLMCRSSHLFRLVSSKGESAEKMAMSFLWRHDLHPHTCEQAAGCLATYLRDFYIMAAHRYADDSLKNVFKNMAEEITVIELLSMARFFDSAVADIMKNQKTAQALARYIDSY